jgi:tight adherence protein C
MFVRTIAANGDLIVACMAAISIFLASLAVFWSYLAPDVIEVRMRRMAGERSAVRTRERMRLNGTQPSLRSEPKKFFKAIFDRLNLAKEAGDSGMVQKLRMAGYRGQGPIVTFLVMRLIMSLALFAVAALYLFIILNPPYPALAKFSVVVAAALAGYYVPALYIGNRVGRRQKSIRRAWPDALDLLLICVESGMAIESALRKVSEEIGSQSPELGDELGLTTAELSYLSNRYTAYENLAKRTGLDNVRGVVTCLVQAEKYGTAIGPALRVFAKEQRSMRMTEAEKKAASLPPKLTVPMIIFFLPVLFAIIITPAVIQIMASE